MAQSMMRILDGRCFITCYVFWPSRLPEPQFSFDRMAFPAFAILFAPLWATDSVCGNTVTEEGLGLSCTWQRRLGWITPIDMKRIRVQTLRSGRRAWCSSFLLPYAWWGLSGISRFKTIPFPSISSPVLPLLVSYYAESKFTSAFLVRNPSQLAVTLSMGIRPCHPDWTAVLVYQMSRNVSLSRTGTARILFATLVIGVLPFVSGQAIDPDAIDLTTMTGFKDLDKCLKCYLDDCWYGLASMAGGCETNICLCRAGNIGKVIPVLSNAVLTACQDLDDASMAVSFYTAYCSIKGYTSIVYPTILQTTGAFTETVTETATETTTEATTETTTETVTTTVVVTSTTVTVVVRTSAAEPSLPPQPLTSAAAIVMLVAAVVTGASLVLVL